VIVSTLVLQGLTLPTLIRRLELVSLRNQGLIDDNVRRRVQRDLDREAAWLDQ
jgi:NhaP-type Na+/H+ or K+/H+ antiporter